MSVTTKHPQFSSALEQYELMQDSITEGAVKRAGVVYLPKTTAQIEAQRPSGDDEPILTAAQAEEMYNSYKLRAEYPTWVTDSLRSMVGMVSKLNPTVVLPERMSGFQHHATADGFDLKQLFLRVVSAALTKGRCPLVVDIDSKGQPYIAVYTAEAAINWREAEIDGRTDLVMAVLEEARAKEGNDEFSHDTEKVYRVLDLVDGRYRVRLLAEDGSALEDEMFPQGITGQPLDFIPLVFAGSQNNAPDVDNIPLLTLARHAVQYYRNSADLEQDAHQTCHSQPVVTGLDDDTHLSVTGPMAAWVLPEGATAFYMEKQGNGSQVMLELMERQRQAAATAGAKVVREGAQAESGESRRRKQEDSQATLHSVVITAAESIEQCLKYAAQWLGISPDDVEFSVTPDFTTHEMDAQLLSVVQSGIMAGDIPRTVLYESLRMAGLTKLSDEELDAMREGE